MRLSKGFRTDTLIRTRPQLGAMFLSCFQAAVRSLSSYPNHRLLRSRFVTSIHRLVEALGTAMLPHLPSALETLIALIIIPPLSSSSLSSPLTAASPLPNAVVLDLIEVISLTNQLVLKFKDSVSSLLEVRYYLGGTGGRFPPTAFSAHRTLNTVLSHPFTGFPSSPSPSYFRGHEWLGLEWKNIKSFKLSLLDCHCRRNTGEIRAPKVILLPPPRHSSRWPQLHSPQSLLLIVSALPAFFAVHVSRNV